MGYPPLAGLVFVPSVGWRFATNPGKMRPRFDAQVIGLHGGTVLFFLCGEIWGLQEVIIETSSVSPRTLDLASCLVVTYRGMELWELHPLTNCTSVVKATPA